MPQLSWFRFETGLPRNPKIQAMLATRSGYPAFFMYVSGLSYCAEHGTGGFIPREVVGTFGGCYSESYAVRYALLLEEHGLWIPQPGGWDVNDWASYQVAIEEAAQRVERSRAAAQARWNGRRAKSNAERQADYRRRRAERDGGGWLGRRSL